MENFDLKKHLIENKLTTTSQLIENYSEEKISQIGNDYKAFINLLRSVNYDDFMEYAEKSQDFNTLNILDYLKKKTKFI